MRTKNTSIFGYESRKCGRELYLDIWIFGCAWRHQTHKRCKHKLACQAREVVRRVRCAPVVGRYG